MTLAVAVAIYLAAPAEPSPAAVAVSRTMLSAENYASVMATMRGMMAAQMGSASEADKKVHADFFDKAIPTYEEMIAFYSGLLTRYYTPEELDELAKFYASPVGKKTIQIAPQMTREVMGFAQERAQRELPKLIQSMRERKAAAPKK
jgi:hypothetical protein